MADSIARLLNVLRRDKRHAFDIRIKGYNTAVPIPGGVEQFARQCMVDGEWWIAKAFAEPELSPLFGLRSSQADLAKPESGNGRVTDSQFAMNVEVWSWR